MVFALNKSRIQDQSMQAVARSVWLVTAAKGIKLTYQQVPGSSNAVADSVSRAFERSFTRLENFKNGNWWLVNGQSCYPNLFI